MERIDGRVVYENPWMVVREDRVRFGDGSLGIYGVIDKPGSVLVIPSEDAGFWMVNPYRYAIGRRVWEFPQGAPDPGVVPASAADLARAELAEETGLRCGELEHVGHFMHGYGCLNQGCDVFLATDLVAGPATPGPGEHGMTVRRVPEAEFIAMIRRGEIVDAATLAAWALLLDARSAAADAGD